MREGVGMILPLYLRTGQLPGSYRKIQASVPYRLNSRHCDAPGLTLPESWDICCRRARSERTGDLANRSGVAPRPRKPPAPSLHASRACVLSEPGWKASPRSDPGTKVGRSPRPADQRQACTLCGLWRRHQHLGSHRLARRLGRWNADRVSGGRDRFACRRWPQ